MDGYQKKAGLLMGANNRLQVLEERILRAVRTAPTPTREFLQCWFVNYEYREVDQAIANLIAANYIIGSATTPITYTASAMEVE